MTRSSACASSAAAGPERASGRPLEWATAGSARGGETTSGDLAVVSMLPDGALVAALDGLGHGAEAARAAATAAEVVRDCANGDLALLIERCHTALRDTRGAAISLAFISILERRMSWLGVGTVEGRVLSADPTATRPKDSLALERGVAGHDLPTVRTATLDLRPGDVLVLATDGIEAAFADSPDVSGSARAITERILDAHRRPADDALVVAVRYLGVRR